MANSSVSTVNFGHVYTHWEIKHAGNIDHTPRIL